MQASGASAVVVADPERNDLIKMYSAGRTDDIISSTFIGQHAYRKLRYQIMNEGNLVEVILYPSGESGESSSVLEIVLLTIMSPLAVLFFAYAAWRIIDCYRTPPPTEHTAENSAAPAEAVEALPLKTYQRKSRAFDDDFEERFAETDPLIEQSAGDVCAICLDEFDDGAILRVLHCKHEFHQECIDQWLLEKSRVCPLCKQDTCPNDLIP